MDEPDGSLERAAALRMRAKEVRELARGLLSGAGRDGFELFAAELDAEALVLEISGRRPPVGRD